MAIERTAHLEILIDGSKAKTGADQIKAALEGVRLKAEQTLKAMEAISNQRRPTPGRDSKGRFAPGGAPGQSPSSRSETITINVRDAQVKAAQRAVEKLEAAIKTVRNATINIKVDSNGVARFQASLTSIQKQIDKINASVVKPQSSSTPSFSGDGLAGMAAGAAKVAAAALAIKAAMSGLVGANFEFQNLMASLETVTGSADKAKAAFATIETFARDTPFTLNQVTEAFIKLKGSGLDPSIEALRSYGNTASAMSKPLSQMIEAVADAVMGNFERLNEFNIKASSEGDKVKMTFRDITTTIGNNSTEIQAYLRRIGDVDFAGGTERQAKTLGAAFSKLQDDFGALARQVGEGGLNDALIRLLQTLSRLSSEGGSSATTFGSILGAVLGGVDDAVKRTANEINGLAGVYKRLSGAGQSVTVPVIDKTTEGLDLKDLNNMTGLMKPQTSEQAAGIFLSKDSSKGFKTTPNILHFGAPEWGKEKAKTSKTSKRDTASFFQEQTRELDAQIVAKRNLPQPMTRARRLWNGSGEKPKFSPASRACAMTLLRIRSPVSKSVSRSSRPPKTKPHTNRQWLKSIATLNRQKP